MKVIPELFDTANATQEAYKVVNDFHRVLSLERMPDDPPSSLEYTIKNLQSFSKLKQLELALWFVRDGGKIVAQLFTEVEFGETNQHILHVEIQVLPDYRRQGIATKLLKIVVETAEKHKKTLIMTGTLARISAGKAFAEALGAKAGMSSHTNQLVIKEIDTSLMRSWISAAEETAADFELGLWTNPLPEEEIEDILALMRVMNTQPREDLDMEDEALTVERIRDFETYMAERGEEQWLLYAKHKFSGQLAGYTEVTWMPEKPNKVKQGDTGVFPAYRGKGIGKWLKASMLEKIMLERPLVEFIRTHNADSNEAMLAINSQMGFKPYLAETTWQLELVTLKAYLERKRHED